MNHSNLKKNQEKHSRPSTKSVSKNGKAFKGEGIRKSKVVFKTSNPPSLDLEQNLPDRYTPNTLLEDFTTDAYYTDILAPDLSVICSLCKIHIQLNELKEHKEYHDALNLLGLKTLPLTLEELYDKRKVILKTSLSKYLKKTQEFYSTPKTIEWSLKVKHTNDAFELVKSYLTNSFESNRQLKNLNIPNLEAKGC